MTEASAADLRHEKQPWLHVTALFEIIGLIDKRLESIRVNKDNLPSDQTKENPSEPQPTPIIIDTGSQARKPASTGNVRSEIVVLVARMLLHLVKGDDVTKEARDECR